MAAMPACAWSRRPVRPGNRAAKPAPYRSPTIARYSTAASVPAIPSWLSVPVSNRSYAGRSLYVGSASRTSRRPYRTPTCGPKNLYAEQARKSVPSAWTSIGR